MRRVPLLANEYTTLYESPDASRIFCYNPGLARLDDGRLVATIDLSGPGARDLPAQWRWEAGQYGYV